MTSEHSSPIKSPKQLIIVVVLAFIIPVTVILFISQLVMSSQKGTNDSGPDDRHVLERIRPVGQVVLAEGAGAATAGSASTGAGAAGSPGGVPAGSVGVAAAAGDASPATASNASSPAPGAPTPPSAATAPTSAQSASAQSGGARPTGGPPAATQTASAAAPAAAGAKPDGKKVFESTCTVCHSAGIAGAPKFGDKAAWAPRLAEGINVLHQHALQGFQGKSGVMPPKGGNTALSDAEVTAAVDYMAAAAK